MLDSVIMFFLSLFAETPLPSGLGWRQDNTVEITFVSNPHQINEMCGPALPGYIILACVDKIGGKRMVAPNPCVYADKEHYAKVLCHELGHTNYWRHEYR